MISEGVRIAPPGQGEWEFPYTDCATNPGCVRARPRGAKSSILCTLWFRRERLHRLTTEGSKSDRPLVRCRNGKTFGNWSQKMLKEVKNTPRVVKCHACQQWQWNFNLQKHYACEHPKVQMNTTDKKICKEIVKPFAEKHLAKVSGATTYAKQGKKTLKQNGKNENRK